MDKDELDELAENQDLVNQEESDDSNSEIETEADLEAEIFDIDKDDDKDDKDGEDSEPVILSSEAKPSVIEVISANKLVSSVDYEHIKGDINLPELDDSEDNGSIQNRFKNITTRKAYSNGKKISIVNICIVLIIVIGSVMVFMNLQEKSIVKDKTLIYELPELKFTVFSEVDNTPNNIKLNVSIGVQTKDTKEINIDEFYNIVLKTVDKMSYEQFDSINAQDNIKTEIRKAFKEKEYNPLDIRVYISGLDLGKSNMSGYTYPSEKELQEKSILK